MLEFRFVPAPSLSFLAVWRDILLPADPVCPGILAEKWGCGVLASLPPWKVLEITVGLYWPWNEDVMNWHPSLPPWKVLEITVRLVQLHSFTIVLDLNEERSVIQQLLYLQPTIICQFTHHGEVIWNLHSQDDMYTLISVFYTNFTYNSQDIFQLQVPNH